MATKVDTSDPQVKRLVYNMYRGMLGNYNQKAEQMLDALPRSLVQEDRGVTDRIEAMMRQSSQISGAAPATNYTDGGSGTYAPPPPPPPPPGLQGPLPSHRLNSEVGPREPPAAVLNAMMSKDKKPFTYTPGGLDLSQLRSPRMQKRISRNAAAPGVQAPPAQPQGSVEPQPPLPPPPPQPHLQPQPARVQSTSPQPPLVIPKNPVLRQTGLRYDMEEHNEKEADPSTFAPPPPINRIEPQPSVTSRAQLGSLYIPPVPHHVTSPQSPVQHVQSPVQHVQSPGQQNMQSPGLQHVQSPGLQHVQSPGQHHVQSPGLQHVQSPGLQHVQSPGQHHVQSPGLQHVQSPGLQHVQSPGLQHVQSPVQQRTPTLNKAPMPWMSKQVSRDEPEARVVPIQREEGTRIIPIQIEGREPPRPQLPTPPTPQQWQQAQQWQPPPQQWQQQPQQWQQPPQQQPPQWQHAQQPANTRIIPIQVEGASPNFNMQQQPDMGNPAPVQSRSFRVLQKITDQPDAQEYQPVPAAMFQGQKNCQPPWANQNSQGETRKLQLSEDDQALMNKLKTQVDEDTYLHTEADPRYRGGAIPSRAFRMLQTMTDTGGDEQPSAGGVRPRNQHPGRLVNQPEAGQIPAASQSQAQEPRKYTGGAIPSRSFRMLQAMTAEPNGAAGSSDM